MGPLGPAANTLQRIGYEALILALPLFVASYLISFLLVLARTCAVSQGRKLWTRPRLLITGGVLCLLVTAYLHWVLVVTGTAVADLHRILGIG